jgi:hypothetical protein
MRAAFLGASSVLVSAAGLVAFACGTELPPAGGTGDAASNASDAGEDAEPRESPLGTFVCGPARCTVGTQVCCVPPGGGGACLLLATGCGGATSEAGTGGDASDGDGGPLPAPTTLACTSYRNCAFDEDCCWSPAGGSQCKDRCDDAERALCEQPGDGCGQYGSCRDISGDPLGAAIGECVRDQISSSSGSGSGSNSSGWGW